MLTNITMFFTSKTEYEPKVGDTVLVWRNIHNGIEQTRTQEKGLTAILVGEKVIGGLTQHSIFFEGEDWEERDFYFLEKITNN